MDGRLLREALLARVDDGQHMPQKRHEHLEPVLDAASASGEADDEHSPPPGRVDDARERVRESRKGRLGEAVGCQRLGERRKRLGEERRDGLCKAEGEVSARR